MSVNLRSPKPLSGSYVELIDNKDSLIKGFPDTLKASPDVVAGQLRERRDELDSLFRPFRRTDTALAISLCLALFGNASSALAGESDATNPDTNPVIAKQAPDHSAVEVSDVNKVQPDWSNKAYVLARVKEDGYNLSEADDALKKDKEVILAAVKQNGYALMFADASLKKDKEVVLAAVKQNGYALQFAHESLKKDKGVVLAALEENCAVFNVFKIIDEPLEDRDVALACVKEDAYLLEFIDKNFIDDVDFIVSAISSNEYVARHELVKVKLNDRNFMLEAVKIDASFVKYVSYKLRRVDDFWLDAIRVNIKVFNFANGYLKNKKEFLLKAVKVDLSVLQFVSDDLKKDQRFMLDAIKQNDEAYRFAHETLRENKRFIMSIVSALCGFMYCKGDFLTKDPDFMLKCMKIDGIAILAADDSLRNDKNFILDAVKENYEVLRFAPSLQKNKEAVLAAIAQNKDAIEFFSKSLKKDPEVLEAFFGQPSYDYKSLSEDLNRLNIDFPERFDLETLNKIVQNRKGLDVNEKQPLAVVIYPKLDDNGAFKNNQMSQLISRNYWVLYYEAGSDSEVYALLKEVISQSDKKADLFVLGGHGIDTSTNMGGAEAELRSKAMKVFENGGFFNVKELMDIADQLGNIGDGDDIDVSDSDEMISQNLSELLSDESVIVLESCSTGQGGATGNNVANLMGKVFPQATVYAPTVPTVILGYEYDSESRVEGIKLSTGDDTVFRLQPQRVTE